MSDKERDFFSEIGIFRVFNKKEANNTPPSFKVPENQTPINSFKSDIMEITPTNNHVNSNSSANERKTQ